MRLLRWSLVALLIAIVVAGSTVIWLRGELRRPWGVAGSEASIDIRAGMSASAILHLLESEGVIRDARLARFYLIWMREDPALHAGEYRFEAPVSLPEVIDKLVAGDVVLHPVTLVEGLDLEETAQALADAGFGVRAVFEELMRQPVLIADLDSGATDLEGYLFPDTYHFVRGATEASIVSALVANFRRRFADNHAGSAASRSLREIVILASIVEKEAQVAEERPLIAGVFANRLAQGIPLATDPTIIYALKREGRWDGNIRRPDLRIESPYNTYRRRGLPPGPIASPGLASLEAAVAPQSTPYLYFVSRNDGTHVFSTTLAEHNRAVEKWQRQYWRERWARERRQETSPQKVPE